MSNKIEGLEASARGRIEGRIERNRIEKLEIN